ncbi:hypothetical protein [Streptomyces wuyuanensis]|uniref:hypothetical protein n=1 Tax=Streptomyces wuyuanensis TaxID=1196353 RepID=UPI0037A96268
MTVVEGGEAGAVAGEGLRSPVAQISTSFSSQKGVGRQVMLGSLECRSGVPELMVIPQELVRLLRQTTELQAKHLSLSYAEQALKWCRRTVGEKLLETSLSYISAARDALEGRADMSVVAEARAAYFRARGDGSSAAEQAAWLAAIGVAATWQREMEAAGIVAPQRTVPSVTDVAKECQAVIARFADFSELDESLSLSDDARVVKWEVARWQLLRAIETAPLPDQDSSADPVTTPFPSRCFGHGAG